MLDLWVPSLHFAYSIVIVKGVPAEVTFVPSFFVIWPLYWKL